MALNAKREMFCLYYTVHLNGARAAREAGYSPKTAASIAERLLRNVEVQARIAALMAERAARVARDADEVLNEIDNLAMSDIGDILDFSGDSPTLRKASEISPAARRTIESIKMKAAKVGTGKRAKFIQLGVVEVKLWNKPAAQKLAAQHRGLLTPKDADGNIVPLPIEVTFVDPDDGDEGE